MIGLLVGEDDLVIELAPKMGGPYDRQIRIKHGRAWSYGEYGIAYSYCDDCPRWHRLTLWVTWGITTYNWDAHRLGRWFKRKLGV